MEDSIHSENLINSPSNWDCIKAWSTIIQIFRYSNLQSHKNVVFYSNFCKQSFFQNKNWNVNGQNSKWGETSHQMRIKKPLIKLEKVELFIINTVYIFHIRPLENSATFFLNYFFILKSNFVWVVEFKKYIANEFFVEFWRAKEWKVLYGKY